LRGAEPEKQSGAEGEVGRVRGRVPKSCRGSTEVGALATAPTERSTERLAPKGCTRVAKAMVAESVMEGLLAQCPEAKMEALHWEGRGVWLACRTAVA
jgi:hypothetical protein